MCAFFFRRCAPPPPCRVCRTEHITYFWAGYLDLHVGPAALVHQSPPGHRRALVPYYPPLSHAQALPMHKHRGGGCLRQSPVTKAVHVQGGGGNGWVGGVQVRLSSNTTHQPAPGRGELPVLRASSSHRGGRGSGGRCGAQAAATGPHHHPAMGALRGRMGGGWERGEPATSACPASSLFPIIFYLRFLKIRI